MLFSPVAFVFLWQDFALAFLLWLPPFFALFKENLSFLRARKKLIKRAIFKGGSLFDRLTNGQIFLKFLAFFIALLAVLSLALNLMYASHFDFFMLFGVFSLLYFVFKNRLYSQFKKSSFNTFRALFLLALPCAFFYALFNFLSFENKDAFLYLKEHIDAYKSANFRALDELSYMLNLSSVLKNFFLFYTQSLVLRGFAFVFDFLNFFILLSSFGLLLHFALKNLFHLFLSFLCACLLIGVYEDRLNQNELILKDKLPLLLENFSQAPLLLDSNLTQIQKDAQDRAFLLQEFKNTLSKSLFELGLWWFSDEKKELEKRLKGL